MDLSLLNNILQPQMVVTDSETLTGFAVDGVIPKALVYPTSLNQVSELVKLANKEHWTITPLGSGSKMGIGNVPKGIDLLLSTSRL
ncbi:MAG: FAD-binding protein, partial [Desulfomonilaceae bacterium]